MMILSLISISVYAFLFSIFTFYLLKYNLLYTVQNQEILDKISLKLTLLLILFAGVRYKTGTDFESYVGIWSGIKPIYYFFQSDFGYSSLEPGFLFFTSILRTITFSEILFLFSLSTISLIPVYYGIKKINSNYLIASLFLYFLVFYVPYVFNGMRQAVAMGIYVYSFYDIINKKKKNIILLTIIASSFHSSGIIILISYVLYNLSLNFNLYLFFCICITLILKKYFSLHFIFEKFGFNMYYLEGLDKSTSFFQLLTRCLIFIVLITFYNLFVKKSENKIIFIGFLKIYLIGLLIYYYFIELNAFATRINMFFRIIEIFLFPIILTSTYKISNKALIILTFFILGTYTYLTSLSNPDNNYHFCFIK